MMKKIIILIMFIIKFNILFGVLFEFKNNSDYPLQFVVGTDVRGQEKFISNDFIASGKTYRFTLNGCIKNVVWYTKERYEQEIDLGFNLGKQKVLAKKGGFKNLGKICKNTTWNISNDMQIS